MSFDLKFKLIFAGLVIYAVVVCILLVANAMLGHDDEIPLYRIAAWPVFIFGGFLK